MSQGIAIGPAYPYHVRSTPIPRHAIDDPVAEMARFDEALDQARATLLELKEQTAEELGAEQAEIFQAHLDFLDDVALRPEIDRRVNEEHVNVEYLVNDLIACHNGKT